MKRVILVAAVAMMALASCKKDYTCECEQVTPLGTSSTSITITNSYESDAKDACAGSNASSSIGGVELSKTTCELK